MNVEAGLSDCAPLTHVYYKCSLHSSAHIYSDKSETALKESSAAIISLANSPDIPLSLRNVLADPIP